MMLDCIEIGLRMEALFSPKWRCQLYGLNILGLLILYIHKVLE